MNLKLILKALGVNIPPEAIANLEQIIPQVPAKAVQIIGLVNEFDARLNAIVAQQEEILTILRGMTDDTTRPAGRGGFEREYAESIERRS